jgi:hypothetical protein
MSLRKTALAEGDLVRSSLLGHCKVFQSSTDLIKVEMVTAF